jgi:hypothetical protein
MLSLGMVELAFSWWCLVLDSHIGPNRASARDSARIQRKPCSLKVLTWCHSSRELPTFITGKADSSARISHSRKVRIDTTCSMQRRIQCRPLVIKIAAGEIPALYRAYRLPRVCGVAIRRWLHVQLSNEFIHWKLALCSWSVAVNILFALGAIDSKQLVYTPILQIAGAHEANAGRSCCKRELNAVMTFLTLRILPLSILAMGLYHNRHHPLVNERQAHILPLKSISRLHSVPVILSKKMQPLQVMLG